MPSVKRRIFSYSYPEFSSGWKEGPFSITYFFFDIPSLLVVDDKAQIKCGKESREGYIVQQLYKISKDRVRNQ